MSAVTLSSIEPDLIQAIIDRAFEEDLGDRGDITSSYTIPAGKQCKAVIVSREDGVVSGLEIAQRVFLSMDPTLRVLLHKKDGDRIQKNDALLTVEGDAHAVLSAERTALNLLGRMTAISSATAKFAALVSHTKARISCTRKTTPGLRALEKYAVHMGGGRNHRFGLYDAVLIKDNHIAVAGDIRAAVQSAIDKNVHGVVIEVEVDTLEQLDQILDLDIDIVLLDNMPPAQLVKAIEMVDGKFLTEASGGINEDTLVDVAQTGVDIISLGWITHSVPWFDVGLDIDILDQ